jgi:adenylate kinase family enzyme
MKTIIWIFGETGAGKSTFIKHASDNFKNVFVLSIGEKCREKFGSDFMSSCSIPGAPTEIDGFVYELVNEAIVNNCETGNIILIDGMPRKKKQVNFIQNYYGNMDNIFLLMVCDEHEKVKRTGKRDLTQSDKQLSTNRLLIEHKYNYEVIKAIMSGKGNLKLVDTTKIVKSAMEFFAVSVISYLTESSNDSITEMLHNNNEFSNLTFKKSGVINTMESLFHETSYVDKICGLSPSITWIRRFLMRAIDELKEALEEVPEKWTVGYEVKLNRVRAEIIDSWHFILSAITASGMNSSSFIKFYNQKRIVNLKRWVNSTTKLDKKDGDDDHVGRFL